jgi:hypothetical protein
VDAAWLFKTVQRVPSVFSGCEFGAEDAKGLLPEVSAATAEA